ncbi:hypothetical protein L195_g034586, partial [Trifolium pratense]
MRAIEISAGRNWSNLWLETNSTLVVMGFKSSALVPWNLVWLEHEDCARVIKDIWCKPVVGSPMSQLQQKLKRLKKALNNWNRNIFGNVQSNVSMAVSE